MSFNGKLALRLRDKEVAAKEYDDEIVVINLINGVYYCTDGVGRVAWNLLQNAHTTDAISSALADYFEIEPVKIRQDLDKFIEDILDENLMEPNDPAKDEIAATDLAGLPTEYGQPVLNRYDDMNDLFALDPPLPEL